MLMSIIVVDPHVESLLEKNQPIPWNLYVAIDLKPKM